MDRQADLIPADPILPLAACADRPAALVGRKAATLAALAAHGHATPGGHVLTSDAFWGALAACGVSAQARYLGHAALRLDPDHVLALGRAIGDGLAAAALDEHAARAAEAVFARVQAPRIVCRSSAAMEDGRDAAFPGMFLSLLDLTSAEDLCEAIAACWRSVFAPTVLRYLLRVRPAPIDFSTALLIQPQVAAWWYGLCFTADPRTADGEMIAELSNASPDALVGGAAAMLRFAWHDGVWCGDGDPPPGLDGIATAAPRLAEQLGCPVDIEFALRAGEDVPVLLQCRPITRAATLPAEASGRTVLGRRLGIPCAPGRAAGRAGTTVLAVERIGTGDTGAVLAARALVVGAEVSPLSHVANLCRELGIPFVSGVAQVDDLADRPLLVDGTAGELLILADEPDAVPASPQLPPVPATVAIIGATELRIAMLGRAEPGADADENPAEVIAEYCRSLGVAELNIVPGRCQTDSAGDVDRC